MQPQKLFFICVRDSFQKRLDFFHEKTSLLFFLKQQKEKTRTIDELVEKQEYVAICEHIMNIFNSNYQSFSKQDSQKDVHL